MPRTALKWTFGIILSIVGFFIAGVLVVYYVQGNATRGGLTSGIVMGSIFFVPGLILIILAFIDVAHNRFDLRVAKVLEEHDRITPTELAEQVNSSEEKVENAVSRIIGKGLIIVYFDKTTGEFVTQEGKAIAEKVIGYIKSKRRTTLEELCQETGMKPEEIKQIVVGMQKRGLFDGTYDWKSGKILSKKGVELLEKAVTVCPNCGGDLAEPPLPGEEIRCEYCGKIVKG